MKKLLLSIGLGCSMLLTSVLASAQPVEVSFCVGDENLSINGETVQVEKPYVVGSGVTLVPLRVITEAFGATVEWIGETKTINLSYPEVEIVLQIGNTQADVNLVPQMLLAAPELTSNGVTMVPLRFISETFGADVTYDETTKQITVTKNAAGSEQTMVEGAIDEKYIGDSYYGWSMENPTEMTMTERSFDGSKTMFAADENNGIEIYISDVYEDYDFERDYITWKSEFQGLTLVKADKDTANPECKKMHFQVKDKEKFLDFYVFVTKQYYFEIWGSYELDKQEVKDEGVRLAETFTCTFRQGDIYDLSDVADGVRKFEVESMKLSLDIPHDYVLYSSETVENNFEFLKRDADDPISRILMQILSKSDVGSAKELAERDFVGNKQYTNQELVKYSEALEEVSYAGFSGYAYSNEIKTKINPYLRKDVFFELGEYVYNICVTQLLPDDEAEEKMERIFNSLRVEELDPEKIGILMRNAMQDEKGTYKLAKGKWSVQIPNTYEEIHSEDIGFSVQSSKSGAVIMMQCTEENQSVGFWAVKGVLDQIEQEAKKTDGVTIRQKTTERTVGNIKYAELILSEEKEDVGTSYMQSFIGVKGKNVISFTVIYPEISYCEESKAETEEILKSLLIK